MVGTKDVSVKTKSRDTVKFLCSYGGKILPRHPDGKLRYVGGDTRVLAVHRSIPFSELQVKLGELCGLSVSLRCQFPTEDLDALVSITSDEDLANLMEEYDQAATSATHLKIRAFLSPPKSIKKISPSSSSSSHVDAAAAAAAALRSSYASTIRSSSIHPSITSGRCARRSFTPVGFPVNFEKSTGKLCYCAYGYHAQYLPSTQWEN
ncbi:hypothetical protein HHK36_029566 [Tetracentron sinense]|uniref:PB1 domain-containing protein n=1 Tax=Tetracentron sinense TaxID=13715 RepID=A0A834YDW6_TETSI|nr:hypothetical protein HHK36_029566 [Tetracentron sinense]